MSLEFAVCPLASPHPRAESLGDESETDSREWAPLQVRVSLRGPNWEHEGLIDKIRVAFAKVSQLVGRRRCPLYLSRLTPVGIFDLRNIICKRRIG